MAFFDDIIAEINKETPEAARGVPATQQNATTQQAIEKEQAAAPAALPFKYDDEIMRKYK